MQRSIRIEIIKNGKSTFRKRRRIMSGIHGGDIYNNHVKIDFSVNTNPLGVPERVKMAMHEAVGHSNQYPDIRAAKLRLAVSRMLEAPEEYLLFGNGTSELFLAIIHGIMPKKTVIPVPSFSGYEYAARAGGGEIIFYETKEEEYFAITGELYGFLPDDVDLIFLSNPNNPTGRLTDRELLRKLLGLCRDRGMYVVLDESFNGFCGKEFSMLPEVEEFENLILVRALTKIFSIPGVRLGYLICSNRELRHTIQRQLPEWNLSCFAQAAGCACATQLEFAAIASYIVQNERCFLEKGLKEMEFQVFPSEANFILFYSEKRLYEPLLERGLLIRDCSNFRGLRQGFYRVAVKTRKENKLLLKAIREII